MLNAFSPRKADIDDLKFLLIFHGLSFHLLEKSKKWGPLYLLVKIFI